MLDNASYYFGSPWKPKYEGCTLTSLQPNLEGSQLFCLTRNKGPHEWPVYFHQHLFSLEFVAVLMLIRPSHAISGVIVDIEKDKDEFNLIFLIVAGMSG